MIELKNYELKSVRGGMMYYTVLGSVLGGVLTPIGGALSLIGSEGFTERKFTTMRNFMLVLGAIGSAIGLIVGYGIDSNTSD